MYTKGHDDVSSMFILKMNHHIKGLDRMVSNGLSDRVKQSPACYSLSLIERVENSKMSGYKPKFESKYVRDGCFILGGVDELGKMIYCKYTSNPSANPSKNTVHDRILVVSRQMLQHSNSKPNPRHNYRRKNELFQNFYKKSLEERVKIVNINKD